MEEKFLLQQKSVLEAERQKIEEELALLKDYPETGNSTEDASLGVEQFGANVSIEQELLETLEEVKSALKRIEKGTYGVCQACKEEIELSRLQTVPYARYCAVCQRQSKTKKKK